MATNPPGCPAGDDPCPVSPNAGGGWHLKKELQLGHIVTTLSVAVSVIWYVGKMEQRIALVEQQMVAQREMMLAADKTTVDAVVALRAHLDRIDAKLDRLVERRQ